MRWLLLIISILFNLAAQTSPAPRVCCPLPRGGGVEEDWETPKYHPMKPTAISLDQAVRLVIRSRHSSAKRLATRSALRLLVMSLPTRSSPVTSLIIRSSPVTSRSTRSFPVTSLLIRYSRCQAFQRLVRQCLWYPAPTPDVQAA